MTLEEAKKATQLLNAIKVEAGLIPLRNEAALNRTTRTLQDQVSQLQQILDLGSLVEQPHSRLEAVIPDASQAGVARTQRRANSPW